MDALRVFGIAVFSRCCVLAWSVLARAIVESYDSSAQLAVGVERYNQGAVSRAAIALGTHWDAAYFSRVSAFGYELEQTHAFFPLVPLSARVLARMTTCVFNQDECGHVTTPPGKDVRAHSHEWISRCAYAGVFLSNLSFCISAVLLFQLGCAVLKNKIVSYRAAILFCFTPASIFMSSFYTEAPFALFSFAGMLVLSKREENGLGTLLHASLYFALASATRANGTILAGYLGYSLLLPFLQEKCPFGMRALLVAGLKLVFPVALCASPVVAVLAVAFQGFCKGNTDTNLDSPWCNDSLPNIYAYVQKRYWGNGFLAYYELKQVPNFLLASPIILLSLSAVVTFAHQVRSARPSAPHWWRLNDLHLRQLPYMLHLLFLLCVAILFMHIQVTTRFLSACPCIYWHAASLVSKSGLSSRMVSIYFACYSLLGACLFSTFYPWS